MASESLLLLRLDLAFLEPEVGSVAFPALNRLDCVFSAAFPAYLEVQPSLLRQLFLDRVRYRQSISLAEGGR